MKNLTFSKASLSLTALALLALFGLAGCGSGSSNTGNTGSGTSTIQSVSTSGQITTPSSIAPATLKVVAGMDSKPVSSNGSFALNLNKDNTQLVMAVNNENNPVLMAIAVNAQASDTVSLSAQSTAESLIYLSPGVAQDDPSDAKTVMDYIKALPETTTLANLLSTKMAANPNILSSETVDAEINTALSNALQALVSKAQQSGGIQKSTFLRSPTITPSYASGIEFNYSNTTNELEVRNYNKRYTAVWEIAPDINDWFILSSISTIGMLTDSILNLQVTTYTSKTTTISNPNSQLTVKAYGLGFFDVVNTATGMSSGDWERLSLPAAKTIVFDIMSPSIGTFLGINKLTIKANNALTHFALDVSLALQGVNLAEKLINGDKKGAITSSIKTTISVLTANDNAIMKEIIKECGADAVEAKIISVFVYAKLFLLTANIGDVILSANSLATTKLVETFIITPSDTTAPATPTGLAATSTSASQINLTWGASTDAVGVTGYKIYRGGTYLKSASTVTSSDTGLTVSTQYCYQVSAYDAAGNESNKSTQACVTTQTATTTGFTGNFLSWTGSDDASHYFTLVRVDGKTGAVTTIGGSDFFTGLAYGPDGRLYGVAGDLHIINPTNGATVKVGSFQYQAESYILMCGAAFSPNGTLYVLENASPKRVFTVNLTNAALTYIGSPTALIRSLQFASNGTLYASFADLFTLNTNDMSTVATVGDIGVYVSSLTFGSGGTLYGMDYAPSTNLYSVNLSTGLATSVTVVGSSGLSSLVAERTATTFPAPYLSGSPVYKLSSPHDVDALLNMEKEIKSARKRLLP